MGARWIAYDWFKLIVLLILIALLILLGRCSGQAGFPAAQTDTSGSASPVSEDDSAPADGASDDAPAAAGSEAPTAEPSVPAAAADTAEGESTGEADQGANATSLSAACEKALPVRLSSTGINAKVVNATLTLRSSPQVGNNILGFLPAGSQVDILTLPVCTEYLEGANNWWEVRTSGGVQGFAAEGSAVNPVYYLEAIR